MVAERELIRVMLSARAMIERIGERIAAQEFRDRQYREIFEALARFGAEATSEEIAAALSEESTAVVDALMAEPDAIQDVERTVHDCLTRLEVRALRERNAEIQHLMTAATSDEKNGLVAEKQANSHVIRRLTEGGVVQ